MRNLKRPLYTETIHLICDSGAFNGGYLYGILLYIRRLERDKFISVGKISGSSIGAVMAVAYATHKLEEVYNIYAAVKDVFKDNFSLNGWIEIIHTFILTLDEDACTHLTDKIFINYFNITTFTEVVQSKFSSNEDLENALIYSSFIPYMINGSLALNNFIDAGKPHIFPERTIDDTRILFIKLTQFGKLKKMMHVKCENNISERMIEGILDFHMFYKCGTSTTLCSWVNNWSMYEYICYRTRQIITFVIFMIMFILNKIHFRIPNSIKTHYLYSSIKELSYNIYTDLFVLFYNS